MSGSTVASAAGWISSLNRDPEADEERWEAFRLRGGIEKLARPGLSNLTGEAFSNSTVKRRARPGFMGSRGTLLSARHARVGSDSRSGGGQKDDVQIL